MKNRNKLQRFIVCAFALTLVFAWLTPNCFAIGSEEANSALSQAERDLGSAYGAVLAASNAGADVDSLLTKLADAGNYLSEAHAAFKEGTNEIAFQLSLDCSNTLNELTEDATILKAGAEKANSENFILTAAGSGAGLAVLVTVAFFGWRFLSRRYAQKLLDMIPTVEEPQ